MNYIANLYGGRIGRLNYFFWPFFLSFILLIPFIAIFILVRIIPAPFYLIFSLIGVLLGLYPLFYILSLVVRRNHDLGHTGWLCLLFLIPLVSFFYYLYLLFKKGEDKANRYGPVPNRNASFIADVFKSNYSQPAPSALN